MTCHIPQHPCHQLIPRPPDDWPERRRPLIGRFKPNIQQYLDQESLSNTSYKSAISSIHQDAARTAIVSSCCQVATAELTLSRMTRTILAQMRTGHSRILSQNTKRIDPTALNHCHNCGHSPHDTHHLFDCPSKPTTRAVESLWIEPTEIVKHLNLAIGETS